MFQWNPISYNIKYGVSANFCENDSEYATKQMEPRAYSKKYYASPPNDQLRKILAKLCYQNNKLTKVMLRANETV